jgi:predicted AAA+ superfamily ATPase
LQSHPKLGASWEGFAVETILSLTGGETAAHFYATHGGAELDLLLLVDGRRLGVEVKRADAPVATRSMHVAMEDLRLDHLAVVYPGAVRYPLAERMEAVPLAEALAGPLAPGRGRPRARQPRRPRPGPVRRSP